MPQFNPELQTFSSIGPHKEPTNTSMNTLTPDSGTKPGLKSFLKFQKNKCPPYLGGGGGNAVPESRDPGRGGIFFDPTRCQYRTEGTWSAPTLPKCTRQTETIGE